MIAFIYLAGFFITAVVLYIKMEESLRTDGDFMESLMSGLLSVLFAMVWPVVILAGAIALIAKWVQRKVAEVQKNAESQKIN